MELEFHRKENFTRTFSRQLLMQFWIQFGHAELIWDVHLSGACSRLCMKIYTSTL